MATQRLISDTHESRIVIRRILLSALLIGSAFALPARADFTQTQIGSFTGDGSNSLIWTLNSSFITGNSATLSGTTNGYFQFTNVPDLPSAYTGLLAATMTVSGGTGFGTAGGGGNAFFINQVLASSSLTISVIQDGTGTNLLTATVIPRPTAAPSLVGSGSAAALIATTPFVDLSFTSGVLSPSVLGNVPPYSYSSASGPLYGPALTLSLVGITPALSVNAMAQDILNSFTAAGSASFSTTPVPEPTSLVLLGLGGVALFGARRWFSRTLA
jgi:hypothetical protein